MAHGVFVQLKRPVAVIADLAFLVLGTDLQVVLADVREPPTVGDLEWTGIAMRVVFSGGDFVCLDLPEVISRPTVVLNIAIPSSSTV